MKNLPLALCLCVVASAASAQSRPSAAAMTCVAVQRLVESSRAVVLGTGGQTYDRFVADQSQCTHDQTMVPGFGATSDNPQCMLGYRCVQESRDPF